MSELPPHGDSRPAAATAIRRRLIACLAVLLAATGASPARAANEVVVRVVFEFKAESARAQYPDAKIPEREAEISAKLAVKCKELLEYWTFEPATPADVAALKASTENPVLRISLNDATDLRLLMHLEGPSMDDVQVWPATLSLPGDIDAPEHLSGDLLPERIVKKFQLSPDVSEQTLLTQHKSTIDARFRKYVPIAKGNNYQYRGPTPLAKPQDAKALLPLQNAEHRKLVNSEFRVLYTRAPNKGVAILAAGEEEEPALGLKVVMTYWEERPWQSEGVKVEALDPATLQAVLDSFAALKCELIYLFKFHEFDVAR